MSQRTLNIHQRQPLFVESLFDHAGIARRGLERTCYARGILGEQHRDALAIRLPLRRCQVAFHGSQPVGGAVHARGVKLQLAAAVAIRQERQLRGIGRPRYAVFVVSGLAVAGGDAARLTAARKIDQVDSLVVRLGIVGIVKGFDVGQMLAVGRNDGFAEARNLGGSLQGSLNLRLSRRNERECHK